MRFIALTYFLLLALKLAASIPEELPSQFKLLPQPQQIEMLPGNGIMYYDLKSVYLYNTEKRPVMNGWLSSLPLSVSEADGTLTLKLVHDLKLPSSEGYILQILNKQVVIQAATDAGLFYGIQTLQQLMEDSHDQGVQIPALKITDYPEISYRAIHLDLKHHLDAGNYYYQMIDKLAAIKINAIIVEFEDKLRYRKQQVVGAKHAISVEEFAAISRYARQRHIEISPLIQGLGHASFILKHEEYKDLRDDINSDWVFDPLNPKTYEVQFSLYEDAMAATPFGKYIHVGGDEVGDLGKSELSKKSGKSPFDLQMYWLTKVSEFAERHGRKAIFWDDMVFKLSGLYKTTWNPDVNEQEVKTLWEKNRRILDESLKLFPKNCIYMRWNYEHPEIPGNLLALDWYKSHGLDVMAATSAQMIWAMMPRDNSNFKPIKEYSKITSDKKLTGILCTIWDDTSPHFETVWRGIYDFALTSWNYENMTADQAHTIFRHRYYAPEASGPSYEYQNLLEQALPFWQTGLINGGNRDNYHKNFKLIDLPDKNKPGEWCKKNSEKIEGAKRALALYTPVRERIIRTNAVTRRNAYTLRVFDQINELGIYPAKLLLLLEKYDQAPANSKKSTAQEIATYINGFDDLRIKLETVFSETRMLNNPEGYQLDSNLHEHLANGTNNTDWMFMYELPMNDKIKEWLSTQSISSR
jgi:hypothetical protein